MAETLGLFSSVVLAAKRPFFEVIFAVDFKTNSSVQIDKFMPLMLGGNR